MSMSARASKPYLLVLVLGMVLVVVVLVVLAGAVGSSGAGLARTIPVAWNQNKTHSQDKTRGQDRAVQDRAICTGLDEALGYCKCVQDGAETCNSGTAM